MYCSKCGKELPINANFCSYCGNKIVYEYISLSHLLMLNSMIFTDQIYIRSINQ